MVDPIGAFVLVSAAVYTASIFLSFFWLEDFTGIVFGVAVATAILYIPRNFWLGLVTSVVGG